MVFYSEFQQIYIWLPLIGIIVGLIGTMIGSGGGFFFPIILILLFQTPAQIAVTTSLVASLPICIVGTVGHYRKGNIKVRLGFIFGIAGIIGAIAGAGITRLLKPGQLEIAFGFYSLLLAVLIFSGAQKRKRDVDPEKDIKIRFKRGKLALGSIYGLAGGMISGTFGTNGTAPVLAGLMALQTPIKLVIGTSIMVVLMNTVSALSGHLLIGEIDLTLVVLLSTGSVLGALAGPKLLSGINLERKEKSIRIVFALILIVSGIVLIAN